MRRGGHSVPTVNQLVRRPRQSRSKKSDSPALNRGFDSKKKQFTHLNSPQERDACIRVGTMTPKKPNSTLRKHARVRLSSNVETNIYVLGAGHDLQEHSVVFVRGGRIKDLPGVRYHIIRDAFDTSGVDGRRQGRSLYGTKRPKN